MTWWLKVLVVLAVGAGTIGILVFLPVAWWLRPLILVAVLVTAVAIAFLMLRRGKLYHKGEMTIDGRPLAVVIAFGSKLPKALGHAATTPGLRICFRSYPRFVNLEIPGYPKITRRLLCNEIFHVVDRVRRGFFSHWSRIGWQFLTIREHDKRPYEIESKAAEDPLLTNTYPGVDVGALVARF